MGSSARENSASPFSWADASAAAASALLGSRVLELPVGWRASEAGNSSPSLSACCREQRRWRYRQPQRDLRSTVSALSSLVSARELGLRRERGIFSLDTPPQNRQQENEGQPRSPTFILIVPENRVPGSRQVPKKKRKWKSVRAGWFLNGKHWMSSRRAPAPVCGSKSKRPLHRRIRCGRSFPDYRPVRGGATDSHTLRTTHQNRCCSAKASYPNPTRSDPKLSAQLQTPPGGNHRISPGGFSALLLLLLMGF